jgi:predicted NACHT family NTPase
VILTSAKTPNLPWSLEGLHCVDFRATDSHPLQRLIWAITGEPAAEFGNAPFLERPEIMQEVSRLSLFPSTGAHDREANPFQSLADPPNQEQAAQLEILRGRVMEYWVDDFLRAIDAPRKYTVEMSGAINSAPQGERDIGAIFDAAGLLLILGEPGSGKTTTLLELARSLLERARDDIKERVPVVLNLSSWQKKQRLVEWISGELWTLAAVAVGQS